MRVLIGDYIGTTDGRYGYVIDTFSESSLLVNLDTFNDEGLQIGGKDRTLIERSEVASIR